MFVMLFSLASCDKNQSNQDTSHDHDHGENLILRVGLSQHENEPHYRVAQQFASAVESKSEGKIKVVLYGSDKLGSSEELLTSLAEGKEIVDILIAGIDDLLRYEPKMNISAMPFAIKDYNDAKSFMESDIQAEAQKSLLNKNLRVLAYYTDGFHCLLMKNHNVIAPEDLREKQIAISRNELSALAIKAMGARTVTVDETKASEIRNGLQQGQYEGYEGSLKSIYQQNLYQNQKYLIMTNHSFSASGFIISNHLWETLDEQQRTIIEEAAQTSSYVCLEAVRQEEK